MIGDKLKALRQKQMLSQDDLALKVKKSRLTIVRWEKGERFPSSEDLPAIAHALNTSVAYLIGETEDSTRYTTLLGEGKEIDGNRPKPLRAPAKEEPEPTPPPQLVLPIIDQEACAGVGFDYGDVETLAIDWMPFPLAGLGGAATPRTPYFVRVQGDSMIGAKIPDGCLVAINPNIEIQSGDIVYVRWKGRCSIKGFVEYGDRVELRPANPNYKSTWIDKSELELLEILGKVVRILNIEIPSSIL